MKNINPLYVLGFTVVIITYFFISTAVVKNELADEIKKNSTLQTQIDKLLILKKEYSNPKKKKNEFIRIVNNSLIKKYIKSRDVKNNKASIQLSGVDEKASKWFMQKLFNGKFKIRSCEVRKVDEYSVDIKVEVIF